MKYGGLFVVLVLLLSSCSSAEDTAAIGVEDTTTSAEQDSTTAEQDTTASARRPLGDELTEGQRATLEALLENGSELPPETLETLEDVAPDLFQAFQERDAALAPPSPDPLSYTPLDVDGEFCVAARSVLSLIHI